MLNGVSSEFKEITEDQWMEDLEVAIKNGNNKSASSKEKKLK